MSSCKSSPGVIASQAPEIAFESAPAKCCVSVHVRVRERGVYARALMRVWVGGCVCMRV